MSEQRLIRDLREIASTLVDYDKIRLINTAGDPVNEYDIEYKVRGYSLARGISPRITNIHRIKIILPLGYPYFHPVVKPLTPIFHPDIDQNTIRIAHYWKESRSLIDLILYIGEMISGKHYSTKNPFDKKAAAYFKKHKKKLPLDSIKNNFYKPRNTLKRPPVFIPWLLLFKMVTVICIFVAITGTALYILDQHKIDRAQQFFNQARNEAENYAYKEAQAAAELALEQLERTILPVDTSKEMAREINTFLDSETMHKGLQGKILYNGKYEDIHTVHKLEVLDQLTQKAVRQVADGNLELIISSYEESLAYARQNNFAPAVTAPIQRALARYKYQQLQEKSKLAHASKDWKRAVTQHQQVIDFLNKNIPFIEDVDKKLSQARHLLLLDEIALYVHEAERAENEGALAQALHLHTMLISHIMNSPHKEKPALQTVLQTSLQKEAYLKERLTIQKQQKWLLAHYKEIFQSLDPVKIMGILRNPQASFIKYNGKKRVYSLSCLDKSGGSAVRLQLYYQFDPVSSTWEVYEGET